MYLCILNIFIENCVQEIYMKIHCDLFILLSNNSSSVKYQGLCERNLYRLLFLFSDLLANSRCTSIAWVPNGDGAFIVAHSDGNFYVYEKASHRY